MSKSYLRQVGLYVLTAVLSVSLTLYIGYHLFYGLTQKVVTEVALARTEHEQLRTDFYIFRDEILLRARTDGSRVPAVADGTRVGVGDTVARSYTVSSPDTVERIAGVEWQLKVLEDMKQRGLSVRDTAAIDAEIYASLLEIAQLGNSGSAAGVLSLRAQLLSSLTRRAIVTGSGSDTAAKSKLLAERDMLTAKLGECREEISASLSGSYYAAADGLESFFTADAACTMTPADFDELIRHVAPESDPQSAGKIAPDYTWYAACFVPLSDTEHLQTEQRYSVRFPYGGDVAVPMTLIRLIPDGERAMLVFRTDRLPEELTLSRSQTAVVDIRTHTGIPVPLSAIRVRDGVSGVYILRGSTVSFRALSILYETEEMCLSDIAPAEEPPAGLSWLSPNDIIITEGRGLYEGRVLS